MVMHACGYLHCTYGNSSFCTHAYYVSERIVCVLESEIKSNNSRVEHNSTCARFFALGGCVEFCFKYCASL